MNVIAVDEQSQPVRSEGCAAFSMPVHAFSEHAFIGTTPIALHAIVGVGDNAYYVGYAGTARRSGADLFFQISSALLRWPLQLFDEFGATVCEFFPH